MDLIVTDTNGTLSGLYALWTLDLAYGSGENDFELNACTPETRPPMVGRRDRLGRHRRRREDQRHRRRGRGHLPRPRLARPARLEDPRTRQGQGLPDRERHDRHALRTVISRIGLQDIITVTEGASKNANWRFDRYCDAWSGLSKMLRASGLRLRITAAW